MQRRKDAKRRKENLIPLRLFASLRLCVKTPVDAGPICFISGLLQNSAPHILNKYSLFRSLKGIAIAPRHRLVSSASC